MTTWQIAWDWGEYARFAVVGGGAGDDFHCLGFEEGHVVCTKGRGHRGGEDGVVESVQI
jgi:hypothetical protein